MTKEPKIFLEHVLTHISLIENFMKGLTRQKLENSELHKSALIYELQVIGEAVKNLPLSFTHKYPQIEWQKMAGLRDKLIHNYFGIDLEIVWNVIKNKLPSLKQQIQHILKELEK